MAYVLANVIADVLTGVPQEHRQNVFYALSGVALESADTVVRGLPGISPDRFSRLPVSTSRAAWIPLPIISD